MIIRFSSVPLIGAILVIASCSAFVPMLFVRHQPHLTATTYSRLLAQSSEAEDSFLLQEFRKHMGEVINPYTALKVPRDAEITEIKASYRKLSRRYHPDIMRHKTILPGSCNNMEEARDQWERIKLSYEILRDTRSRKKYDRHEMLADPKAAMGRAAWDVLGKGIRGVGKGMFDMGAFAVNQVIKPKENNGEQNA